MMSRLSDYPSQRPLSFVQTTLAGHSRHQL